MAFLPAAGMALSVGGSLIKGAAGMAAGKRNAATLAAQANEEYRASNDQVLRIREGARAAMGNQVGAQFANGFEGGTGSALDALRESQIGAALDALSVRREAAAKARNLNAEAANAKRAGKMALFEGILGAGSAVLGQRADWASARSGQVSRAPAPAAAPQPNWVRSREFGVVY